MSRTSQTTAVECSRCRCALSAREWQSLRSLALPSCGTRHLPKSWLGPQNSIVLILDTYEILVSPIQRSFIKFCFHFIFQQQGSFSSRNFLPNLTQEGLGNRRWDVWTCFSGCSLRATRLQRPARVNHYRSRDSEYLECAILVFVVHGKRTSAYHSDDLHAKLTYLAYVTVLEARPTPNPYARYDAFNHLISDLRTERRAEIVVSQTRGTPI